MEDKQPITDVHMRDAARTVIATAELDPVSFAWLDELRRRHFPADHNFLSAHLTMFHQVSLSDAEKVAQLRLPPTPLAARFTGVRFLGRGVAINVASAPLTLLRETMRRQLTRVSAQDSQSWRPHVTVQNKVAPSVARRLYEEISDDFMRATVRLPVFYCGNI
jgi:2'-5' RNA ligase superfamily protein